MEIKTLEYHLPCYDKGVYSFNKSHDRDDCTYEVVINGTKYILHFCNACLYAQSRLSTSSYGRFVILMDFIFNYTGVFNMYKFEYTNESQCIECPKVMKWVRNNSYHQRNEMDNNPDYIKIDNDSYNTFYVKRNLF